MAVSKNSLKGTLCVLAAGMCWGTTGTIQAFAPEGASSLTVGSARVVFSGIVLMLFMLAKRGRGLFAGGWCVRGVLLAAAGLAAYQLTFFTAVRMTGVAVGTMVAIGAAPPVAGICGRLFFGERLSARWYAATALAVAGCVMLVLGGSSGGGAGSGGGDGGGRDAEGLLQGMDELAELEDGQGLDLLDHGGNFFAGHYNFLLFISLVGGAAHSAAGASSAGASLLSTVPPFFSTIWPRTTARLVMGASMVPRTFA